MLAGKNSNSQDWWKILDLRLWIKRIVLVSHQPLSRVVSEFRAPEIARLFANDERRGAIHRRIYGRLEGSLPSLLHRLGLLYTIARGWIRRCYSPVARCFLRHLRTV